MAVNQNTAAEELYAILKQNDIPDLLIAKLEEHFIDGESFIEMGKSTTALKEILPQYGLQVKFKGIYAKVTGNEIPQIRDWDTAASRDMPVMESSPMDTAASRDVPVMESSPMPSPEETIPLLQTGKKQLFFPAPLPKFSPLVQQCLDAGKIDGVWHKFIAELADFYIGQEFAINTQAEYRSVGQTLIAKYPCVAGPDRSNAWGFLCKSLSAKIRSLRLQIKRKSDPSSIGSSRRGVKTPTSLKRAIFEGMNENESPQVTPEKHLEYVDEIKRRCQTSKPDESHLRTLLRNTFRGRREWIKTIPDTAVAVIVEEFPVFKKENLVKEEMELLVGKEAFLKMGDNFDRVMGVIDRLRGQPELSPQCSFADVDQRDLENLAFLHSETKFDKGKGLKSSACWTLVKESDDPEKTIQSKPKDPPHLFICTDESGKITAMYICADGIRIFRCEENDVKAGMLSLLSSYYAFDLDFPKIFSQCLGFLQHYVVGQTYCGKLSAKYSKFVKRFIAENQK